jgi:alkylation response protein AidB-like acyl-CoA dehydrogenase
MTWELDAEHVAFRGTCRAFTDREVRPLVDDAEAKGTFPGQLWARLGAAGLLGLTTAEEFGGSGGDALAVALLAEELTRASGGIAVTALVSGYMAGPHVTRYGSPAQQQRWCAALASGEAVAAIAVTEPGMGSDVAGMASTATRTERGWVLAGRKMFITNAGLADVLVVAARTQAGAGARHSGVTLFLVEKDAPGLSLGRPLAKMGWHSSDTREVILDSVEVGADAMLGVEGRGFGQIMEGFQLERIALAGMGLGHAAECFELAKAHVREREAFGAPLAHLQTIRHRIALMEIELEAARLVTYQAAQRLDTGHPEDAVQLFGGSGFLEETPVARHYRDSRVLRIGGGTDEVQLEILTKWMAS